MPPRRFSTDVPSTSPRRRSGILKARLSAHLYQVDFGLGSEWAYYPGDDLLDLGAERSCVWDQVTNQWWIRPLFTGWFVWGSAAGSHMPWAVKLLPGSGSGPSDTQVPLPAGESRGIEVGSGGGDFAFSRDGQWFATAGFFWTLAETLVIWPVTGTQSFGTALIQTDSNFSFRGYSLDWAPNSRWLAISRHTTSIGLAEFAPSSSTFPSAPTYPSPGGYAQTSRAVQFSPDGAYLAVADNRSSYAVTVFPFDADTGVASSKVTDPSTALSIGGTLGRTLVDARAVAWRPQGDLLALHTSCTNKGPSDPWDEIRSIHAYIWTGSGFGAKLPDIAEADSLQAAGFSGHTLKWTADGRYLVACDDGGDIGVGPLDPVNGITATLAVYEYTDASTALALRGYVRTNRESFIPVGMAGDFNVQCDLSPLIGGKYYVAVTFSWNRDNSGAYPDYNTGDGPNGYEIYELDPATGALSAPYLNIEPITDNNLVPFADDPVTQGALRWYPV